MHKISSYVFRHSMAANIKESLQWLVRVQVDCATYKGPFRKYYYNHRNM